MRPIYAYFDAIPFPMETESYRNQLKMLLEKVAQGKTIKTAEDIKGYAPSDVKIKLETIFHKKCAFCESDTKAGAVYDTEHFRPKKNYYWLAYEWSNFLLSCQRCNREYKLGRFPIRATRAMAPIVDFEDMSSVLDFSKTCHIESDVLKNEERLLLPPVLDNPTEHLGFHVNGVLAKSEMGEQSIRFYGLNDWENREELIIARKKVIKTVENRVKRAVDRYEMAKNKEVLYYDLFDIQTDLSLSIAQSWDADSTNSDAYMSVIIACLQNFKDFFLPPFVNSPYAAVLQEIVLQIEKEMAQNE
jgi:uncharacterized protein (TIGR02646 family)